MATTPYQDAYNALVQSLVNAGNVTATQFQALSGQFTAAQFAQIAEQSEQFSAVRNLDESIRFFQMNNPDCEYALAPASTGGGLINSNEIPATNNPKNTFTSTLASSSVLNIADTVLSLGEVRKPAQTGTQKALAFASRACLPVQIASVATMLGKQIDGTIYKLANAIGLNPPAELDPQTWDGLVSNDNVFGQVFNWLLNVDPATGELSAYADLDSVAYCAQWLKQQGFFDAGAETTAEVDTYTPQTADWELSGRVAYNFPFYISDVTTVSVQRATAMKTVTATGAGRIYSIGIIRPATQTTFFSNVSFVSDQPITAVDENGITYTSNPYAVGGVNYYCIFNLFNNSSNVHTSWNIPLNSTDVAALPYDLVRLAFNQDLIFPESIPGVEDNGGQVPDTSTWTDIPAVKQSLLQQYPDMATNPIEVDTVQPDGSTKQYTYVPVPLPADIDQLGNPDTQNVPATQQSVDPETATNPQLQMIIQLLTQLAPLLAPVPQPEPEPGERPEDVKPPTDGTNETNPDYTGPTDTGIGIAPVPVVPTGTASALWTVYNPSQSELNAFGAWLWSPAFIDNVLKLFANPMDGIIGIHKIFAPVPSGSHKNIKCGFLDSGVSAATVNTQYIDVDCGTVNVYEYFGNVLDYDPNTKVAVYLPFIGVVPLKTAEVMRSSVNITYGVDLYTGSCLAKIRITRDGSAGGILYSFGGSCACYYPLSAGSYSGIISGILSSAVGIAGSLLSGNPMGAIGGVINGLSRGSVDVQHSGGFTGPSGVMGPKQPYIIVLRPQPKIANDYALYDGVPSNSTVSLRECHGYTKCKIVHLNTSNAYYSEIQEIENLLKAGVIL